MIDKDLATIYRNSANPLAHCHMLARGMKAIRGVEGFSPSGGKMNTQRTSHVVICQAGA